MLRSISFLTKLLQSYFSVYNNILLKINICLLILTCYIYILVIFTTFTLYIFVILLKKWKCYIKCILFFLHIFILLFYICQPLGQVFNWIGFYSLGRDTKSYIHVFVRMDRSLLMWHAVSSLRHVNQSRMHRKWCSTWQHIIARLFADESLVPW